MLFYINVLAILLCAECCTWSKHFFQQKWCGFTTSCWYYQTSCCQLSRT